MALHVWSSSNLFTIGSRLGFPLIGVQKTKFQDHDNIFHALYIGKCFPPIYIKGLKSKPGVNHIHMYLDGNPVAPAKQRLHAKKIKLIINRNRSK